jgi:hypothetical protein
MNRLLLSHLAAGALLLATAAFCAADLSPFFNPQTMLSADQVQRGMTGVIKTVYQGTAITENHVEILGAVQKFNLGEDIILAKMLDGPVVEKKIGVIAGMSGSPVYVGGKLIGALAFSWPFMTEPIFGITSISSMLKAWDRAAGAEKQTPVARSDYGVQLAGRTVTRAQVSWNPSGPFLDDHTIALRPAAPLIFCSGFSSDALKGLEQFFRPWGITPLAGPGALRDPVDVKLEPGASVGVQLLSGDFDISGIGTITYVQDQRVLAFGHQLLKLGGVDFPLTTAWIHGILPSLDHSTKMGSVMKPVGALRQDTPWGIGGQVGAPTPSVSVEVRVTDGDSGLQHVYSFRAIQHDSLTPMLVTMGVLSSLDASYSPGAYGMLTSNFTMEGTKGARVTRANTAYFEGPPANEIARSLLEAAALFRYNLWEPQSIKSVRIEATLSNRDQTAMIERVYSEQAVAKAGEPLVVHVVIRPWGGQPVDERISLALPPDLPATNLEVGVAGGALADSLRAHLGVLTPDYDSLQGMLEEFARAEDNTQLLVLAAGAQEGMSVGATRLPSLPQSVQSLLSATVPLYLSQGYEEIAAKKSEPWVLFGGALLTVPVESRTGERPTPPSEGGKKPPSGPSGESEAPPPAPSPPAKDLVWPVKSIGRAEFTLPEYPPRSLAWAAGGLRADIAAQVGGRRLQAEPPSGPTAMRPKEAKPGEASPEEKKGAKAAPKPEAKKETPSKESETKKTEEGVGLVLRQPSDFVCAEADDFKDGHTQGTGLASEGGVLLVPTWRRAASLSERTLFAAACAPDGALYFSADGGRLYRLKGDKVDLFCNTREFAVTALAVRSDGSLLAGCSTSGKILQISPQGQVTTLAQTPARYIWAFLTAPDGTLYVGTGPRGVLYKLAPGGACTPLATLPANHLLALAWRGEELVAGTAQEGEVYVVTKEGAARVVFGSSGDDVTSLAVDEAGNIYAGAAPSGQVTQIAPNGEVKTVYDNSDTPVYALLATRDGVYVGTAPDGKIFLIRDREHTSSVLLDSPADFVSQMLAAPDGQAYALGNGPGGVLACSLAAAREGTYLSPPLDASFLSTWGKITWDADAPAGAVTAQCRSGNTDDPEDGSWSAWAPPASNGGRLELPPARYLQYRLRLQAPADQPALVRRVDLSYLPANQAPTVEIKDPSPGDALHEKVKLTWNTSDPDNDALQTTLYLRPAGGPWQKLTGPTKEEKYEWDTTDLKSGRYDLRLVVSDVRSNPTGSLEAEALVRGLLVDNEPPTLVAQLAPAADQQPADVAGTALDEVSGVVSVSWKSADDDKGSDANWSAARLTGPLFGAPLVSFAIPRAQIPEGVKAIVVRAIDAAGNYTDLQVDLVKGTATPEQTPPPRKPRPAKGEAVQVLGPTAPPPPPAPAPAKS